MKTNLTTAFLGKMHKKNVKSNSEAKLEKEESKSSTSSAGAYKRRLLPAILHVKLSKSLQVTQ